MGTGLILPNTPEIREYCARRNAEIASAKAAADPEAPSQVPRMEDNAEYQSRKLMSTDEKFRQAVEELARRRKIYWEARGEDRSFEACKAEMIDMVVKKYARDHGIE